jgi:hypothetical protein
MWLWASAFDFAGGARRRTRHVGRLRQTLIMSGMSNGSTPRSTGLTTPTPGGGTRASGPFTATTVAATTSERWRAQVGRGIPTSYRA